MSQTPAMKICPYLRTAEGAVISQYDPTQPHYCHATGTPFSPSAVQQSSCCLNSAIFSRCPYFANAKAAVAVVDENARVSRRSTLFSPLARLLGRKKRKRIYLF